jgi:hypothetical protein
MILNRSQRPLNMRWIGIQTFSGHVTIVSTLLLIKQMQSFKLKWLLTIIVSTLTLI